MSEPTDPKGPAPEPAAGGKAHEPTAQPAGPLPPRELNWFVTLRKEPPVLIKYAIVAGSILAILLLWQACSGAEGTPRSLVLPRPSAVWRAFKDLTDRGILDSILTTVRRVVVGFAWATVVGVALGILGGAFRGVGIFLSPAVVFLRSVPMVTLVPLTVAWFGIEEQQKEMFIFIACLPFIVSDTAKAMSLIPERYVETAQTLGASRAQILVKVLIPLALPDIITGLRIMFSLALGYVMIAEGINPGKGLGYVINLANTRGGDPAQVFPVLIIIALLAFGFDWIVRTFQRELFRYRRDL